MQGHQAIPGTLNWVYVDPGYETHKLAWSTFSIVAAVIGTLIAVGALKACFFHDVNWRCQKNQTSSKKVRANIDRRARSSASWWLVRAEYLALYTHIYPL